MEEYILNNERRNFLKQSLYGSIGIIGLQGLASNAFAASDLVKITILSTNDVHSHIDPFPDNDPKFAGLGGAARRAALINEIRRNDKNVLLLDAGDVFQGTPYFNRYGGELEFKLMSAMGYDASTIGNHDFDNGLEGLAKQLPHAQFPFINCNYDFTDTPMQGKTIPYKIIMKDGIKVGIFGIGIELDGLVDKRMYGNTKYSDPVAKAARMSLFLKEDQKCDLVVCLSHLGFSYESRKISDVTLAKQSRNIDLIIGGHTHTFLDTPVTFGNRDGKEVIVSQVGWAGIKLGKISFYFERNSKKRKKVESASLLVKNYENFG
ncbi:MAG: metallophosphatase [Bacteroidota bacterium]